MNEAILSSFIEALYEDKLSIQDRYFRRDTPHREKVERVIEAEDALQKTMTPQQKELFEAYLRADDEVRDSTYLDRFVTGFRLGGRCVYDIFLSTKGSYEYV